MSMDTDVHSLKNELRRLFKYVQRVRAEIAAIDRPSDNEHQFERMSDQLDAIVGATEDASNTIMEAVERNDTLLGELRAGIDDPEKLALIEQISGNGMTVIEACSFQDITGQRVSKVVKSVAYVEDRVNALIDIWGKSALDETEIDLGPAKTEDEKLLHGPQRAGKGISQDEIDKLFD